MKISILGCGWYGIAMAKWLLAQGHKVKGSTTSAEKVPDLINAGIDPYILNLHDEQYFISRSDIFDCDILIISVPPKARNGEKNDYVEQMQRVINAIVEHQIKKVIFISSISVYGRNSHSINKHTRTEPDTYSGQLLLETEKLFKKQKNFKTTIVRFSGLVGPGRHPGNFFAGKNDIPNGLTPVNLIHLDDCIGITQAIIDRDMYGYTINACSPDHPTKSQFYTFAAEALKLEAPQFIIENKEWKLVGTDDPEFMLKYQYKVDNWYRWLGLI
jgi:nucleoside-diphosphate-sugar epimerase